MLLDASACVRREKEALFSTGDLLRALRFETWSQALRAGTFYDFMHGPAQDAKCEKPAPSLPSILFNAA